MFGLTRRMLTVAMLLLGSSHSSQVPMEASTTLSQENYVPGGSSNDLTFSDKWYTLGPFSIGTREAPWGADPLERFGGFHGLTYSANESFRSALGTGGLITWATLTEHSHGHPTSSSSSIRLAVDFPDVDWSFHRSIYGWAGLQHQAWTRGHLKWTGPTGTRVVLFTDSVLELWVNNEHYWGCDFYGFRNAPIVVTLHKGVNQLDIRVIHDVRAMGGGEPPSVSFLLEAHIAEVSLQIDTEKTIISDVVCGRLVSPFASISVHNTGEHDIEIVYIMSKSHRVESIRPLPIRLVRGQSRPLTLGISLESDDIDAVDVHLRYRILSDKPHITQAQPITLALRSRSILDPHKFTFQHPSGSVSYAVLRPPSKLAQNNSDVDLPVLLNLHGAGLEADSHQVRHMLDDVPDLAAWTVFPTGMSQWSSDDWHTFGFADVRAAVEAIPLWIANMQWVGPGVRKYKWFVSGHSNGGQGTWFILTHQPDKVIAAAPASGYTSIQNYVPYTMWQEADPRLTSIIGSSLSNYRHELLTSNFDGIPILDQHGSADDNVPAYHSRLMSQLVAGSRLPSEYVELSGKGHWWEGAMTTQPLQDFYHLQLQRDAADFCRHLNKFTTIYPNSYEMGCRGGICVDQLESPDMLGMIGVEKYHSDKTWEIETSNIHRFHLKNGFQGSLRAVELVVDGGLVEYSDFADADGKWCLVRSSDGTWKMDRDHSWRSLGHRFGRQVGAMDAILRTLGPFLIRTSGKTTDIGLQISRNFLQYFGADSELIGIEEDLPSVSSGTANVITIAIGDELPEPPLHNYPIRLEQGTLILHKANGNIKSIRDDPGLGAVFLRPLPNERLELVVWGADVAGLRQAARLVPTLTGSGQPDFVILGSASLWKGHAGVHAMGFFDYQWKISGASFIR